MQEGANHLLGRHDFTTFRSSICQADSPVRTLDELRVVGHADGVVTFHVRARSFLHNQVRSFVGTLERVGAGAWAPEDVATALAAKDRSACGPLVVVSKARTRATCARCVGCRDIGQRRPVLPNMPCMIRYVQRTLGAFRCLCLLR